MPELSESEFYTSEDERQRKIARYRMNVWELFREQMLITDDMRVDPPYRQNRILMHKMAGALICKLFDEGAIEHFKALIQKEFDGFSPGQLIYVNKLMERMFEEACKEYQCKEEGVRSYLKSVQCGGQL
jgi:hypothetical protein